MCSSSPAIGSDGTVYIGSCDNKVYALNGFNGCACLELHDWGLHLQFPAIKSDGTVYVGSFDRNVYALNGSTGALVWSYATGAAVRLPCHRV